MKGTISPGMLERHHGDVSWSAPATRPDTSATNELRSQLREHGIEDLSVVHLAIVKERTAQDGTLK
jgi:hypothetical protein